ncbi:MAG: hypothetical protein IJH79_01280 [Lentisphaeria bacterium]|nr:hypothetical protein [Lentisphaeria bacterium]
MSSGIGISPKKDAVLNDRKLEFFHHRSPSARDGSPQTDSFAVLHPLRRKRKHGLYVVLHSAGHDLFSCLGCVMYPDNHNIYHPPEDLYGLFVDCRAHQAEDFWWGGINAKGDGDPARRDHVQPVEERVCATVEWVIKNYPVDPERVYLCGNSMGGSGALGIGMCRGDLFAAVKVNVAAGVEHMLDRCFRTRNGIPDPPVCIDYSAQNDEWSAGHAKLYQVMREHKFAFYGYWADFGHANNDSVMLRKNDLIHSFDWLSVRRDQAYPVFTGASPDDRDPWEFSDAPAAGQVNAFFRWKNVSDRADSFRMKLFLVSKETLKTMFPIPGEATADVSLRRLQNFRIRPGEKIRWSFGGRNGIAEADGQGLLTIPRLTVSAKETVLELSRKVR